ncbi:MAG: hypothetical protein B7Y41_12555 [Hydrogenophilales bacterium 28-61-23]|nr:MAG: hypothetical protein B7Y41_12555 [Hydrogenophilales bacterium 28-61-23]
MKGLVFTELMEMIEASWSLDMVDAIIARSKVASGGAYTAAGAYPHEEMVALLVALSEETKVPVPDLALAFGRHLFGRFAIAYPRFFQAGTDTLQFLGGIEGNIHAEVSKLYPDAELPTFEVDTAPGQLTLTYFSNHPSADLAQGLIEGCIAHFGEKITLRREPAPQQSGAQARFVLNQQE